MASLYEQDREARAHWIQALQIHVAMGRELAEAVLETAVSWEYKGESAILYKGDVQRIIDLARKIVAKE